MREPIKRFLIGFVAVAVIGVVPVIALAANGASNGNGAKPVASHGPKRTPAPTPTTGPTAVPTLPPTPVPTVGPTAPPTAVLVGAGDIASCASAGDEATSALLGTIAGTVFTLGDNVYDSGTPAEFTNCYAPTWGVSLGRTRPAAGNHAAGYYGYFGAAAGDPAKGYYAYTLSSGWRVYVLNSNCSTVSCSAGSAQEQWLRTDLAANPSACVVAMWHHPTFSSGSTHGSSTATQALYQALYDFNAELILAGHEHNYERFAPQTATGTADSARGLVEFVVGTGGRSHYGFKATAIANSLVRDATTFGVLKLTLSASSWSFNFLPVAGQTFSDSGSGTCH